mmetsp:Transcript_37974/g.94384  ORF Transcript_37974/g.94384 Transcript_37974/m.94384 type:complete len:227 (-) Transcript_37974:1312-1992(-)
MAPNTWRNARLLRSALRPAKMRMTRSMRSIDTPCAPPPMVSSSTPDTTMTPSITFHGLVQYHTGPYATCLRVNSAMKAEVNPSSSQDTTRRNSSVAPWWSAAMVTVLRQITPSTTRWNQSCSTSCCMRFVAASIGAGKTDRLTRTPSSPCSNVYAVRVLAWRMPRPIPTPIQLNNSPTLSSCRSKSEGTGGSPSASRSLASASCDSMRVVQWLSVMIMTEVKSCNT